MARHQNQLIRFDGEGRNDDYLINQQLYDGDYGSFNEDTGTLEGTFHHIGGRGDWRTALVGDYGGDEEDSYDNGNFGGSGEGGKGRGRRGGRQFDGRQRFGGGGGGGGGGDGPRNRGGKDRKRGGRDRDNRDRDNRGGQNRDRDRNRDRDKDRGRGGGGQPSQPPQQHQQQPPPRDNFERGDQNHHHQDRDNWGERVMMMPENENRVKHDPPPPPLPEPAAPPPEPTWDQQRPPEPAPEPEPQIWGEVPTPDGKVYYYHKKTRETSWIRPEGSGVKIVPKLMPHPSLFVQPHMAGKLHPGYTTTTAAAAAAAHEQQQSPHAPFNVHTPHHQPITNQLQTIQNGADQMGVQNVNQSQIAGAAAVAAAAQAAAAGGQGQVPWSAPYWVPQAAAAAAGAYPSQNFTLVFPPAAAAAAAAAAAWGMHPGYTTTGGAVVADPYNLIGQKHQYPHDPYAAYQAALESQIPPDAYEWSEHVSPGDGRIFYYSSKTQTSTWEKPAVLLQLEATRWAAYQSQYMQQFGLSAGAAAGAAVPGAVVPGHTGEGAHGAGLANWEQGTAKVEPRQTAAPAGGGNQQSQSASNESKKEKKSKSTSGGGGSGSSGTLKGRSRPISVTPISSTDWCVVWTGDSRVFFYNSVNKTSVWEKPQECLNRADVDELLKTCPEPARLRESAKVKKAEATSTTNSGLVSYSSSSSETDKLGKEDAGANIHAGRWTAVGTNATAQIFK